MTTIWETRHKDFERKVLDFEGDSYGFTKALEFYMQKKEMGLFPELLENHKDKFYRVKWNEQE